MAMKITESMVAPITNGEVLQVLLDRGADGKQLHARAKPSEKLAYRYLSTNSCGVRDPAMLKQFVDSLQKFKLTRAEILNIVNVCPQQAVELAPIVDRYSDEEVNEILDLVAQYLTH